MYGRCALLLFKPVGDALASVRQMLVGQRNKCEPLREKRGEVRRAD